jgi:hypothetical protein
MKKRKEQYGLSRERQKGQRSGKDAECYWLAPIILPEVPRHCLELS